MKTIKITMLVLACLLTVNIVMAITPEKKQIEKEKSEILNKIRKSLNKTGFTDFVKAGEKESIVLRCTVNENNEVAVSKVIGFNEDLKNAVRKRMEKKVIKTSDALSGEELALRLSFEKFEK